MAQVIGVRFKDVGKIYYFDPLDLEIIKGSRVIVETARGVECGEVAMERKEVSDEGLVQPLKPVIRVATKEDLKKVEENHEKEKQAFDICLKKIADHKLDMKLVEVEYTFDNSKVLFYFTAEGRVDFRELVKDLASVFRTRIELRHIGVREEAKVLDDYFDLLRTIQKVNAIVITPEGKGTVIDQNLLTGILTIRLDKAPDAAPATFHAKQVKVIKDGQIRVNKEELEQLKGLEKN